MALTLALDIQSIEQSLAFNGNEYPIYSNDRMSAIEPLLALTVGPHRDLTVEDMSHTVIFAVGPFICRKYSNVFIVRNDFGCDSPEDLMIGFFKTVITLFRSNPRFYKIKIICQPRVSSQMKNCETI